MAAGGGGGWLWYMRRAPKIVLLPSTAAVPPSLPVMAPPQPPATVETTGVGIDMAVARAAPAADLAVAVAGAVAPAAEASTPEAARPAAGAPAAPAPAAAASAATAAPQTLRERIAALIDGDKLADAERLLLAQAILEPKAGWVHLDLGELYYRRIWRKDAEREWTTALALDPSLRSDPRLSDHLCATLGAVWQGAGQRLVRHLGAAAAPALAECAKNTSDPARAKVAARLVDRVKR